MTMTENISRFCFNIEIPCFDFDGGNVAGVGLQVAVVRLHEVRHVDGGVVLGNQLHVVDNRNFDQNFHAFVQGLGKKKGYESSRGG